MKNYKGLNHRIKPSINSHLKQAGVVVPKKRMTGTGLLNQLQSSDFEDGQYVFYTRPDMESKFRRLCNNYINALKRREVLNKNRKNRWSPKTREKYRLIAEEKRINKDKEFLLKDFV